MLPGLFLLLQGCIKNTRIVGEYTVAKTTFHDQLFLAAMESDGRVIGSELKLQENHMFFYQTCGNEMSGTWNYSGDSLLLYVNKNVFRSDSMRSSTQTAITGNTIVFVKRGHQLYRTWPLLPSRQTVELLTQKNH